MVLRLTLVCAAATPAQRRGVFPADDELDARSTAEATASALPSEGAPSAWTSPAPCARQTAQAMGWNAAAVPALRDCDFGRWTGRSLKEIEAVEAGGLAAWLRDPDAKPHGGDSFQEVRARVTAWIDSLPQEGAIIAVTHAVVIRAVLLEALRAPPHAFRRIEVAPLSVTKLRRIDGAWAVDAIGLPAVQPATR